jgi:hypothetical protein
MSIRIRLAASSLALGVACAAFAAGPDNKAPPLVDEIIAKHVAARGGLEPLRAIKNITRTGRLVLPENSIDLKVSEVRVRPSRIRVEVTLQGLTAVQAWDGKDAWQVQPFEGRKDPARMSADEAKDLALSADIDTPLVDYKAKGHTVEYLGLDDLDGTPAYMVRVHLKSGDEMTYWIDPDTSMILRSLEKQLLRGAEQLTETDYGDYEQAGGVYFPTVEEQGAKGSDASQKQKFVYEKILVNTPVDEHQFALPPSAR